MTRTALVPLVAFAVALPALATGCTRALGVVHGSASDPEVQGHDHVHDHAHDHVQDPGHAHARPHGHAGHEGHAGHHHDRPLLRNSLRRGWCDPFEHLHASRCGTPLVHGFLTEPAFLGRDLILGFEFEDEGLVVEAEVEWALTRRVLLVAEVPWLEAGGGGIGDVGLGVRALLAEHERMLFSAQVGAEFATGAEEEGRGEGHAAGHGSLHAWFDLGGGFTLQGVAGLEHVPGEDEWEAFGSATLARSFCVPPLLRDCGSPRHDHGPTALTLMAEIEGARALGSDEDAEGRLLLGASVPVSRSLDLRVAWTRTLGSEAEDAWVLGAIVHF